MLLESKDIYNSVASENDFQKDLVESIGNSIFKRFSDLQRNPPDIILDLQYIGRRFLRKKMLEEQITKINWQISHLREKDKDWNVNDLLDELEILTRLFLRYEEFLEAKRAIKRRQYEFYASMGLAVPSLEVYKTSEDNPLEHKGVPPGTSPIPGIQPTDITTPGAHHSTGILPPQPDTGEIS